MATSGLFDWNYQSPQEAQNAYIESFVPQRDLSLQQISGRAAAGIGAGLGRLFGGKAPQEVENELMKGIFSQAAQATTDPVERMTLAAKGLRDAGMEGRAIQLEQEAAKLAGSLAKTKVEDPTQKLVEGGKYTTASIAKYRKSGNIEDLVLVEKDKDISYGAETERVAKAMFGKQFKDLTKEEADAVDKRLEQAGVTKAKAGATNVSQVVTNKAAEQFGSKFGSLTGEQAAQVEGKYSAIDYLKEAETMLDQGIYAGQWGPEKMLAAKATGGLFGDMKKVENTEQFLAYVGNIVIPRLTEFGGNDSVEELKYLRSVMAGEQRLEPGSMKAILKRAERNIQRGIERIKRQTEAIGVTGVPLDAGPSRSAVTPKPTQRFNPQTGKLEKVQ